jgi:hypothetical protein
MFDIVVAKFREWTHGKNSKEARISIFNQIRDIPYAVIPELNDPKHYIKILEINRGSCTPKHLLICNMFRRLGLQVFYVVYQYKWDEFEDIYPPDLKQLARSMPPGNHLACKVELEGKLVLVDATLDPAIALLGLPVNKDWDGINDTLLPVEPCSEEQLHHVSEANIMQATQTNKISQLFYDSLNSWMEIQRSYKQ